MKKSVRIEEHTYSSRKEFDELLNKHSYLKNFIVVGFFELCPTAKVYLLRGDFWGFKFPLPFICPQMIFGFCNISDFKPLNSDERYMNAMTNQLATSTLKSLMVYACQS